MDKNLLICLSCESLIENMEEMNLDYSEINKRFNEITKDSRFILTDFELNKHDDSEIYGDGYIVIRKNDLVYFKKLLGEDVCNNKYISMYSLSEIARILKEQYTYGIEQFEDFNFYWDEVYENIEHFFINEEFVDDIFENIRKKGLNKYIDGVYKKETKSMIEYKFKQLQDIINNSEVQEW